MAIQTNFKYEDRIYEDAYIIIKKIITSFEEIESLKNIDENTQILEWVKVPTTLFHVFVYADKEARKMNAMPIHHFGCEFDYNIGKGGNIYKEAYEALKKLERFKNEEIKDV